MKVSQLTLLVALTIASTAAAKTFDLRQRNLAPVIEEWVKEAKDNGTFSKLPVPIQAVSVNMDKGDYTVDGIEKLREIADLTLDYLSVKYGRQLR